MRNLLRKLFGRAKSIEPDPIYPTIDPVGSHPCFDAYNPNSICNTNSANSILIFLFLNITICCAVTNAYSQPSDIHKEINSVLLDKFKDCSLDLRYNSDSGELKSPTHQVSEIKVGANIKDGYASINLQFLFHDLRISQLSIPTTNKNVYMQYRVLIESTPIVVKKALQRAWNVEFEKMGPDGMDDKVLSNFRMRTNLARVVLTSDTDSSSWTFLECDYKQNYFIKGK